MHQSCLEKHDERMVQEERMEKRRNALRLVHFREADRAALQRKTAERIEVKTYDINSTSITNENSYMHRLLNSSN